ncbi:hypothetical protein N7490_010723 [Penicillium lividum]|nr:hypothetical protein N7490_010723 [Penicillium lividum]
MGEDEKHRGSYLQITVQTVLPATRMVRVFLRGGGEYPTKKTDAMKLHVALLERKLDKSQKHNERPDCDNCQERDVTDLRDGQECVHRSDSPS